MFKKRIVKREGAKKIQTDDGQKEKDISNNDDGLRLEPLVKRGRVTIGKCNKDGNEEPKEVKDQDSEEDGIETANNLKSSSIFKADSLVDEQHNKLRENEEMLSESKKVQKRDADGDKIYRGLISRQSKKEVLVKPLSTHVKQNFIMDYQRDVCKDFLKNGYCGFGDTCKFLHFREEFKRVDSQGEKDWEKAPKRRRKF